MATYGSDPRGRSMSEIDYQKDRYENQQGPLADAAAYNYGRAAEANYGDYTDIMNQYRNISSGGGSSPTTTSGGGGGGGGGGTSIGWNPVSAERASYKDPFNSYAGFTEFSNTGGYSPEDIANMRSRGVSPIRAAYANAEREMSRQRSLQGGYSANAFASLGKMAREQGQAAADATQNVEAGLASERQKGRLAGLTGMSGIEGQRLGADVDLSKFNSQMQYQAGLANSQGAMSAASASAAARNAANQTSNAAAAASRNDQLRALGGMTELYGTTPGMAATFGEQAINLSGQGGTFGRGMVEGTNQSGQLGGAWDTGMGRMKDIGDQAGRIAYPWLD